MTAKSRKRAHKQSQVVTTGSTMRIETPQSNRQHMPHMATVVVQEINPVGGFVEFLREHAVVGLAIGFIIGLQAQTLVKQLVDSFINPLVQLIFGKGLKERTFTLHFHDRGVNFSWGAFAYGLLNFIFVLGAIYFIVKFFKLDKLEKKLDEVEVEEEKK